jgi:hypothetical protein
MGVKLFGLNIGKLVYGGIKGANDVLPMTLVKVTPGTRNPAAPLDGTNPTETSHACRGFGEDPKRENQGTVIATGDNYRIRITEISILGASIAGGVEPTTQDKIVISSTIAGIGDLAGTWRITHVDTDPARALFVCRARSGG